MKLFISTRSQIITCLMVITLLASACSDSDKASTNATVDASEENLVTTGAPLTPADSESGEGGLQADPAVAPVTDTPAIEQTPAVVPQPASPDTIVTVQPDKTPAFPDPEIPAPPVTDPVEPAPDNLTPVGADPLIQNITSVKFDIEVPAYQSDALQVRVAWGEKAINASWVGDEFWSVTDNFPTNTESTLTVTFYDDNGSVTLGSFERTYKTGVNSSESYTVSAADFDTDRWDSDGDGVSNLDELLAGSGPVEAPRLLLFSETRQYRHDSIPVAVAALKELAATVDFQTDVADDSDGVFTDENLASYDAVVWVLTSGDVLNTDEQAAFERYIGSGGGYAGIHAASDTEYDWPWYGDLVGAYFQRHPVIQAATQIVEDNTHPSTAHLNGSWTRTDEWYDFRSNPRAQVNVLMRLDETSYSDGGMGEDHPIAWYHEYEGGLSWYTGGGHTSESYSEPDFRAHLLGGLRYVVGLD